MKDIKTPNKALLITITILLLAHICAVLALCGLALFSPIVSEMGEGSVGVTITALTFGVLLVNAFILIRARRNVKNNPRQSYKLLIIAGVLFIAYNLIAALLNTALLTNLVVSIIVVPLGIYLLFRLKK